MHFLQNCSLHDRPADKLCGLKKCAQVLCDYCFLEHNLTAGHATALLLSPHALNFFTTFTGYTHYKMFEWADAVRRYGFFAVFAAEGGQGRLREGGPEGEALGVIGLRVLEEYQTLTQNNRQFVLNNRNTQDLLHPQFLKDLFNLATEQWHESAQIIISNLAQQVEERFGVKAATGMPKFCIRNNFSNSVQSYRTQLLGKNLRQILLTAADIQTSLTTPKTRADCSQMAGGAAEAHEQYELPYSIKQIESFEEIGQRGNRAHNTVCSIAHEPVTIEEVEEPPEDKVDELTRLIEALKLEKAALEEENRTIKDRNAALERDKQELSSKLYALEKTNKENSQPALTSIPSKANFILKIPARVLPLAESLPQECEAGVGGIGRQMFVRKVRVVK